MANPNLYLYCEHTDELIAFNKFYFNEYKQATHYKMLDEYIHKHLDNNDVVFLVKDDSGSFINTGVTLKDYFINQSYVFSYEEFLSRVPIPNTSKMLSWSIYGDEKLNKDDVCFIMR